MFPNPERKAGISGFDLLQPWGRSFTKALTDLQKAQARVVSYFHSCRFITTSRESSFSELRKMRLCPNVIFQNYDLEIAKNLHDEIILAFPQISISAFFKQNSKREEDDAFVVSKNTNMDSPAKFAGVKRFVV